MKGTDFVATNVPGPPIPVYLQAPRSWRMFYAPKAGAAVNCALMSYKRRRPGRGEYRHAGRGEPAELVDDLRAGMEEVVALGVPAPVADTLAPCGQEGTQRSLRPRSPRQRRHPRRRRHPQRSPRPRRHLQPRLTRECCKIVRLNGRDCHGC